jgi:hypothetical protein
MSKTTLNIDHQVLAKAKRFAAARGTSVPKLVERYLELISVPISMPEDTPVLGRLRGSLRGEASDPDWRERLC